MQSRSTIILVLAIGSQFACLYPTRRNNAEGDAEDMPSLASEKTPEALAQRVSKGMTSRDVKAELQYIALAPEDQFTAGVAPFAKSREAVAVGVLCNAEGAETFRRVIAAVKAAQGNAAPESSAAPQTPAEPPPALGASPAAPRAPKTPKP